MLQTQWRMVGDLAVEPAETLAGWMRTSGDEQAPATVAVG